MEAVSADCLVLGVLPPPAVLEYRLLCLWQRDCDRVASMPIFPDGYLDVILHRDGPGRRVDLLESGDALAEVAKA